MRMLGSLLAAAVAAAGACPAKADDLPGLAPSSSWNLVYDTDSCALRRMFGEGDNRAYLELRQFGPRTGLQITVASARMRPENPASFRFRFNDADDEWNDVPSAPTLSMSDGFRGVIFSAYFANLAEYEKLTNPEEREAYLRTIDFPAAERDFAAKANTLIVRGAFRRELQLRLGPMTQPYQALSQCIDELMTHWDIDVEAHKTLTRPARPIDMAAAASMVSYPPKMVRQSMPGIVNVRLAIDETGKVTGCRIQMPLSDPEFEGSSCADIEHAFEFEPALDKDGKPIASYWITKVIFQIATRQTPAR